MPRTGENEARFTLGLRLKTAMFSRPYYDEDGKLRLNDPNIRTTEMECTNGHRFVKKERGGGLRPETWVEEWHKWLTNQPQPK